jgi:hypothetical protein
LVAHDGFQGVNRIGNFRDWVQRHITTGRHPPRKGACHRGREGADPAAGDDGCGCGTDTEPSLRGALATKQSIVSTRRKKKAGLLRRKSSSQRQPPDMHLSLAARSTRGFAPSFRPPPIKGRRECRAPMRPRQKVHGSNHGHAGIIRHSPRNGFTVYFALPGDRALLPPSPAELLPPA